MRKFRKLSIEPKLIHLKNTKLMVYHLHPAFVPEGEKWHAYLVEIVKDSREQEKIKFLELAEKALTQLSRMGGEVTTFSEVLRSIVEDSGIYEYQYGVFFMLYAQFQQAYGIEDNNEQVMTTKKMLELIGDDNTLLKTYRREDKNQNMPLPVYIRNSIAHQGTNMENTFEPEELRTALEFLRKCLPNRRHKGL